MSSAYSILTYKKRISRFFELVFTPGALSEFVKSSSFSLAAYLQVRRILNYGIKPNIIIDIGANHGQFTLACLRHFPQAKIYSIEPNPNSIKVLSNHIANSSRVTLIKKAISNIKGFQKFYGHTDHQASSLLETGAGRKEFFESDKINHIFNVEVDTLDSLFADEEFDGSVLIKIDVQGYEDRVLQGAHKLLGRVSWVIVEISFYEMYKQGVDAQRIFDIMKEMEFVFMGVLDFHTTSGQCVDPIIEMDALFVNSNQVC